MKKFKCTALILTGGILFSLLFPAFAEASFDKSRLIDDSLFDQEDSMSAAQIDEFLNSRSYSCISKENGFEAKEPTGYSPSTGFQFGDYVSAGKVIYRAAQVYDINPRVLLATLQKEQSLVSSSSSYCNNGSEHKYTAAMGYGCPDSGSSYSYTGVSLYRRNGVVHSKTGKTCVNSKAKAGFSQQVIRAAWLLKFGQQRSLGNIDWAVVEGNWDNSDDLDSCYGGPMTRGNHQVCPSGSTIFYDGYRTIDGVKTYMGTGATAALYWYTPHFHGNENFVEIFESWFGATTGTPLFRIGNADAIYILGADDNYYHIPSRNVLEAYGYGNSVSGVKVAKSSYVSGRTFSGSLPLIARFGGSEIYMMSNGRAHHFTSRELLQTFAYDVGDEALLRSVDKAYYLSAEPMQTTVRNDDGPQVYSVENGKKRHIINGEAYLSGSPDYASRPKVQIANDVLATIYNGAPILTSNKLLKRSDDNSYAYWDGTKRQNVSNRAVSELGIPVDYAAKAGIIDQLPAGGSTMDKYLKNSSGDLWVMDNRKRFLVSSSDLAEMGLTSSSFILAPDSFFNEVPATKTFRRIFRINNSEAIYLIEDSKRHHFNDSDAVDEKGFSISQAINLNTTSANLFPYSGQKILSKGTLFKVGSSDKIYVVNTGSTSLHVPSRSLMNDYGFAFGEVQGFTSQQTSGYPQSMRLGYFIKDGSNNVWHIQRGKERRSVSAQMQDSATYDLNVADLPPLDASIIDNYSVRSGLTNLIQAVGDTRVFKIENGTKRWITTKAAFDANGFSFNNVTTVSSGFLKSLPTGANIQ